MNHPHSETGVDVGKRWEYTSAKVNHHKIEDATIAVRIFGQGPPLVLIHGYPVHGYTWRKLLPTLAEQFTCYVVDVPGLGDSDWLSNTDFSFTAQARRLGLWLESLGLSQWTLIAHDTGATLARLAAVAHPDRVDKLIILNTEIPGHRPPWIPLYRHLAILPGAGAMFRLLMRSKWFVKSSLGLGAFYSDRRLFNDPAHIDPYVKPLINSSRRMSGALAYLRGIEWKAVDGLRQGHSKIKANTLVLWGEDDQTFPVNLAQEMCSQLNAPTTFVRIPNASLLPHEEQPEIVLKHVVPFLKVNP